MLKTMTEWEKERKTQLFHASSKVDNKVAFGGRMEMRGFPREENLHIFTAQNSASCS